MRWLEFHDFWHQMTIPHLQLRYEDLRTAPLGLLLNLISFLLPDGQRPDISQVLCALELDKEQEAYASAKRSVFSSWDSYTPQLRSWVVQNTADQWCRFGYDALLESVHGRDAVLSTGVDCKALRSGYATAIEKADVWPAVAPSVEVAAAPADVSSDDVDTEADDDDESVDALEEVDLDSLSEEVENEDDSLELDFAEEEEVDEEQEEEEE